MTNDFGIMGLFPSPVYITGRDSNLDLTEEKEIEDIIKEGMHEHIMNSTTNNSYIFDDRLKGIKQFCEQQIDNYVKEIINPKEELDFYITQSWLNVTKPGQGHHKHRHSNSLISGVFYVSAEEGDSISFVDPLAVLKERIIFEIKDTNPWNSVISFMPVKNNQLVIFPSWLKHGVEPRNPKKVTTDRISISFNVFVRGVLGGYLKDFKSELILK